MVKHDYKIGDLVIYKEEGYESIIGKILNVTLYTVTLRFKFTALRRVYRDTMKSDHYSLSIGCCTPLSDIEVLALAADKGYDDYPYWTIGKDAVVNYSEPK